MLKGKVAVITGGGRGIGEAYAHAMAAAGASVVVSDLDFGAAKEVVRTIKGSGGAAFAVGGSVSDYGAMEGLAAATIGTFGAIDIVVANAGIMRCSLLHEMEKSEFDSIMNSHVCGTFNCYRQMAPIMIGSKRGGSFIFTGAAIGEGEPARVGLTRGSHTLLGAYRAAKAAIATLALHAAGELKSYNINVNSIMPGATAAGTQAHYYDALAASGVVGDIKAAGWPDPAPIESVPALGVYLASDAGRSITGKTFQLSNNTIIVPEGPTPKLSLTAPGRWWMPAEIASTLPNALGAAL